MERCSYSICDYLFNLHENVPFKVDVCIRICVSQIFLVLLITQFVSRLIFAVIIGIFLDGVIY